MATQAQVTQGNDKPVGNAGGNSNGNSNGGGNSGNSSGGGNGNSNGGYNAGNNGGGNNGNSNGGGNNGNSTGGNTTGGETNGGSTGGDNGGDNGGNDGGEQGGYDDGGDDEGNDDESSEAGPAQEESKPNKKIRVRVLPLIFGNYDIQRKVVNLTAHEVASAAVAPNMPLVLDDYRAGFQISHMRSYQLGLGTAAQVYVENATGLLALSTGLVGVAAVKDRLIQYERFAFTEEEMKNLKLSARV